ncbi:MAG: hypothetical protein RLZZ136_214 [Pseudomonadota bacterium]
MRRRILTGLIALGLILPLSAQAEDVAPAPVAPPRLVVAISVDQFSADLFAQYRQVYTAGLARLTTGAVFPSAFQSHAATETCPGHSTILTGVHPARSGIIANNWFDLDASRAEKKIYCAENEKDPTSTSKAPVVSAGHLRVPTLGEWMKAAWPESRNVAVSGKDRAVVMMGGHTIDQGYWWTGHGFGTFVGRALAPEVVAQNAVIAATLHKGASAIAAPVWCAPHDRAVQAGSVTVGKGRFALAAEQGNDFRISPRLDAATLDLALRFVNDMKLGKGATPDLLAVSLSATDYVGHAYGTEGEEMCIQMANLDAALGNFFTRLDKTGIDYAVVLTADHGGLDMPERLDQQALPDAGRATMALTGPVLSRVIGAQLALNVSPTAPLINADAPFGDYYIAHDLPDETRGKVQAALVAALKASPQVDSVFTREEIMRVAVPHGHPQDWSLIERVRASYDPERSGDVYSILRRAVVPIPFAGPGYVATHGSPWDYDRRVPLLFWRKGMAGFEQPAPVETVDIAPSLAALLHLAVPAGSFDGRCLDLDGGEGNTCR